MANTKITSHVIESNAILSTHISSGAISSGHLSSITSDNVSEGSTNVYHTAARARGTISVTGGNLAYDSSTGVLQLTDSEIRDVLSAGTGVTYSSGQFSIGQAVGTSDTVTFGNITTAGYLRGPASFTIDPAAHGDNTGTVIIAGNLQVDGTTTTINSTTLTIDDKKITLAEGAGSSAAANESGIEIGVSAVGASSNPSLLYASSGDKFVFNKGLDVTGNIGVTGTVDGVDIAARDSVLTSTTTTAGAALPKTGGTMTGDLILNDNVKLEIGSLSGGDLQIYHNASHSYIDNAGTGNLYIRNGSKNSIFARADGEIILYHNDSAKLATNSGGVTVTGTITSSGQMSAPNYRVGSTQIVTTGRSIQNIVNYQGTGEIQINGNLQATHVYNSGSYYVLNQANNGWNTVVDRGNGDNFTVNAIDGYKINGTTVIDSNRNIISNNFYFGATDSSLLSKDGANIKYMADGIHTFWTYNAAWTERASIDDAGLNVVGNILAGTNASVYTSSDRAYFVAGTSNSSNQHLYLGSYHGSTLKELTWSGSNNAFYPQTSASINIGLSSHKFKDLHLSGTANAPLLITNDIKATGSGGMSFQTDEGTKRLEISDAGEIGIGLGAYADPRLKIKSAAGGDPAIHFDGSAANRGAQIKFLDNGSLTGGFIDYHHNGDKMKFGAGSSATPTMTVGDQAVGIGTDSPTVSLEVTGTGTLTNELALTAINKTISEQARDVFIYDTSKDSDGGAWRHRTQHTSWYNEASSSTRSSTKKFPAVAIIVSTSSKVTIYDGDYTDTPMWMEFSLPGHSVASNWASTSIGLGSPGFQGATPMDVAMLNGQLVIGCQSGSNLGGYLVNFINELMIDMVQYGSANDQFYHKFGDISQRNVSTTRVVGQRYSVGQEDPVITGKLSSGIVNDVDMTVLPDAPINVTTGLPEPTIILATNSGINIIRDDGAMAFITAGAGSSYNATRYVRITDTHNLIFEQDSGDRAQFFISLPDASRTTQTSDGIITDKVLMRWYETGGNHTYAYFHGKGIQNAVAMSGDEHALVASDTSELTLVDPYIDSKTQTSVAYIGADYNTGWMTGASHLASLCGKVTGNLTSVDALGGIGNFTSSGLWSFGSGWSLSSNIATGSGVTGYLTPATNGILTQGEQYKVTITQSSYTLGALYVYVGTGSPGGENHYASVGSVAGTFTFVLTAYNGNFGLYGAGYTGVIDNVTVVKCEADRSPHEDGLIPFGSIGRTLVNTNAELVGYGPFSSANYLEHKGFTFGSTFIVSFWMKTDTNSGCVFHTAQGTRVEFAGGAVRFTMYDGTSTIDLREQVYPVSEWTHVVCVRNGTTGKLYVNGRFVESQTISGFGALNNDGSKLTIGDRSDAASEPFNGKISLFRITKNGTITDDQVYKYYTQERPMFAVGAQVTIGGTDDVNDLAYDSDTKLLHIGNGSGKSSFSGLNMVDFTSDAVGTTIAASGGMIVED